MGLVKSALLYADKVTLISPRVSRVAVIAKLEAATKAGRMDEAAGLVAALDWKKVDDSAALAASLAGQLIKAPNDAGLSSRLDRVLDEERGVLDAALQQPSSSPPGRS